MSLGYHKGEILTYHFPARTLKKLSKSNIIVEYHRVVILHQRQTPYNTVIIAPITKASSLKEQSGIPSNYVELTKNDYPFVLDDDSYINLDMTMVVDFQELSKLERYCKPITACLLEHDLYQLDYKIALTYEMSKYIKNTIAEELHREFESVVEFIDSEIRQKINSILSKTNDIEMAKEIIDVIDYLTNSIRKEYLKTKPKK